MDFTPAKRGQLAVVEATSSYVGVNYSQSSSNTVYFLVQVLGVGRDGRIIRYRELGKSFDSKGTPARSMLVNREMDIDKLIADMDAEVKELWCANQFSSLDDVKEYVFKF
jgi:hypothetical protein